ncbi:GAF domain-containing protein [Aromatoleum diolicum]|uniref:GAF domain-containing protein n=2 Tax=Aromatoleum diolicum TaxID=75796 RepID=A0ABX1Q8N2_9RHOO|nr:GAF domain-containing protein [Aromatoleum diolicum]
MFSRPENDSRVMATWERFLCGEESSPDALRRLIDDSWRRCFDASVDPARNEAPPPLPENSLYSLRDEHGELLSASTPVMALAREFLSETGTVMVLTDHSGTILNLEGDSSTRGAAENVHLLSGANWSELACGTNAIGTALEIGQPVQIHSAEHYCAGIKLWTCSATVIRDPYDGTILGVIDVSGLNTTYNRHSLALVVTTAGRIENRLAKLEMDIRYRLLEYCMRRLTSATSDGIIVLDRRGNPIKANERVSSVLTDLGDGCWDGVPGDLSSLALGRADGNALPATLPAWIRKDWLEPVIHNGQRIGTLLTLPNRRGAVFGSTASQADNGEPVGKGGFERVIGQDPALMEAVKRAQQLARSSVPVLLLGETGVGKDVFARCIHDAGATKDAPFVALNCGGFSRELLTSELFGYAEGSFTGARRGGMMGKVEAADGGTLFLDEIGEMPLDLQPHFLRVLEEGEVYRLGENKPRKVKFRLIAATNRDLRKEIDEGRFRMDLFYRVAVTSIRIPALRDHPDDIPLLAEHYLRKVAAAHGIEEGVLLHDALDCLKRYRWPGNVREFRNVIESMLLTSHDARLSIDSLPAEIRAGHVRTSPTLAPSSEPQRRVTGLEQAEREAILRAIRSCSGNMAAVARELGIAKSTLYLKLKRFELDPHVDSVRGNRV